MMNAYHGGQHAANAVGYTWSVIKRYAARVSDRPETRLCDATRTTK
ncbi:unnamed protein product [Ectocarpus sp. 8 AP-2014]